MSYQNVGTPRFYIDIPTYLNSIGVEFGGNLEKGLFNLDPTNPTLLSESGLGINKSISLNQGLSKLCDTSKFFLGFLNHDIGYDNMNIRIGTVVSNASLDSFNI